MSGILVIQTAFLGDVVLTTPLIQAAAERFRPLTVSALVIPSGAAALGHPANPIPGLHEIIVYDKRGRDKGFISFHKLVRKIREHRFEVALLPHRSARSAMLAYLAGIPVRVGFDQDALKQLLTHRVTRDMSRHDVERNLSLLDPFGGTPSTYTPKLAVAVTDKSRESARILLADAAGAKPLIGIAPGSVWGTKQWLPEGFAGVMDRLSAGGSPTFVIVGGPGDVEAARKVAETTKAKVINLAGKTTIPEMIAVIERLDLFITNDTGPMHIAVALDVPVAAIFGATTPALGFSPYTKNAVIIEPPDKLTCRPCSAHGPKSCPEGHFRCMRDITPEMVVEVNGRLKRF